MIYLFDLVFAFRNAVEKAHDNGDFDNVDCFCDFPNGCCGLASELLGHFLLEHGIESDYVCGDYIQHDKDIYQSHAWLKLEDGIIIDITGDQFKNRDEFFNYDKSIYIGPMDDFHNLFVYDFSKKSMRIEDNIGYGNLFLVQLYSVLQKYL